MTIFFRSSLGQPVHGDCRPLVENCSYCYPWNSLSGGYDNWCDIKPSIYRRIGRQMWIWWDRWTLVGPISHHIIKCFHVAYFFILVALFLRLFFWSHNGILAGARRIYDDLERWLSFRDFSDRNWCISRIFLISYFIHRNKILDDAISHEFSGFKLRIIGHSLGAGIAAMLGLMLRQKFPTLRCLCFSPPGCVFSQRTARESKDYALYVWFYCLCPSKTLIVEGCYQDMF